jgi:hypothetical protein
MQQNTLSLEQQEHIRSIYSLAVQRHNEGKSEIEIKDELVKLGLDETSAWAIVNKIDDETRELKKKAGGKNILYGALWLIGGLIATAASDGQVLFYGAIIAGLVQLITGIVQAAKD